MEKSKITRLEISKQKLNRLEMEVTHEYEKGKEESKKIPFGQPNIKGRSDMGMRTNYLSN